MTADAGPSWTRRALLAGVGLAAAAGGVLWYGRQGAGEAAPADLWEQRFPRPDGGELALATLRGRPLLINFWATWCPPCVKEMPELDRFARAQAGKLAVVGLAIDAPEPVRVFLKRQPVSFDVGLAALAGSDLARALGNPAGSLPFTVLLDARGAVARRKLGETHFDELQGWAAKL
jgi:thiol-disulfide isomerase/thioredoxin